MPRRVWTKPAGGNQVSIKFKVYEGSDSPIKFLTITDWPKAARGSPFWESLKNVFRPISLRGKRKPRIPKKSPKINAHQTKD